MAWSKQNDVKKQCPLLCMTSHVYIYGTVKIVSGGYLTNTILFCPLAGDA